jgi:hypothetical protein
LERARKRLDKRAKKGFRGYPVATVALYGPDDIVANIAAFGKPASEVRDLGIFSGHDTDSELRCQGIVWAIKGHSRHRVATESLLGSLVQPLACALQHLLTPSGSRLTKDVRGG